MTLTAAWWTRFPITLRRVSKLLSEAWIDGAYLTAWPKAALIAPAAVFLFGLLEGATHWSFQTYTSGQVTASSHFHAVDFAQMLPLLFVAAICGALSSQLGLLLVTGFALGDFLIAGSAFSRPGLDLSTIVFRLYAPQLISYFAFFLLAVTPALTAKAMAASLPRWTRKSSILFLVIGGLAACFAQGISVYAWTLAAPMIVRVQWIWVGTASPITVFEYIRILDPWLPLTAAAAMAVRIPLSLTAKKRLDHTAIADVRRKMLAVDKGRTTGRVSPYLNAAGAAFVTTILISGLIDSVFRGLWVFAVLAGLFLTRSLVLPKLPAWQWWSQLANRIPLVIRWVATILAAYGASRWILSISSLSPRVNPVPGAFGAEIFCFLLSLVIASGLLPARSGPEAPTLSNLARRSGKLAALGIIFVLATKPVYASICLDPFCCFGASTIIAALVIAALLVLLLPFLLDALLFSRVAILLGMAVEDALAAITSSAFARTVLGRVLLGLLGLEASEPEWEIPQAARDKIPAEWGDGEPNNKKVGWRWFNPDNPRGQGVRIDQGDPDSQWPSQRVDHVIVRDGQPLGPDGQKMTGGSIAGQPDVHIPLPEWLQWPVWNKAPGTENPLMEK